MTTPLGKPAQAGEQVYHIDHITTTGFFPDGTGKKDGSYDIYISKRKIIFLRGTGMRHITTSALMIWGLFPTKCLHVAFNSNSTSMVPVFPLIILRRCRGEIH